MSPIIYTPHDCETPEEDLRSGTLWQCEVCETIWEARRPRIGEWDKIAEPRKVQRIADAHRRPAPTPEPTAPTVTPDMVRLVLYAYFNHSELAYFDDGTKTECRGCLDGPRYEDYTIQAHAREMAANVLQDALRGETRG